MNAIHDFVGLIKFRDSSFVYAFASFIIAPFVWNTLARLEYSTHFMTKFWGGNKKLAVYALAVYIFFFSLFRDYLFEQAIGAQGVFPALDNIYVKVLSVILIASGMTFTLSAIWRLGIINTYLGDYFGILMKERVTSFPFNVMEHPMYDGAAMNFVGLALWHASPVGLILSAWAIITYKVACRVEGDFTTRIYEESAAKKQKSARRNVKPRAAQHED